MDKKLFVEINKIKINTDVSKSNNFDSFDIDDTLGALPPIHTLFDTIIISELSYANESVQIIYKDENFFINSSKLTVKTKLNIGEKGKLNLDIEQILLKDFDVDISGNLSADIKKDIYDFEGIYRVFDISGGMKLNVTNDILTYNLNSNEFASPKIVLDNINAMAHLHKEITSWIYGYTKAASYRLLSLEGKVNLSTFDFYPRLIKAQAIARDINVTFHERAPAAHADNARLDLGDNKIVFTVDNATYEGKKADADVVIYNLIDGKSGIRVDIRTGEYFDESVNKIIKAFVGIELPIRQTKGVSNSSVSIDVTFADVDVNVIGRFAVDNASISIANISMFSPHAILEMNNTIFNFVDARLRYADLFDISANGTLNASARHMEADSLIHHIWVEAKNNSIVSFGNIFTPFTLDIVEDGINLDFREFDANLTFGAKNAVALGSLDKIYPYSELMQRYALKSGNLSFESADFESIEGKAYIEGLELPLFSNGSEVTTFNGTFGMKNDRFSIDSSDNKIRVRIGKSINVRLDNFDMLLDMNSSLGGSQNSSIPVSLRASKGDVKIASSNATILSEDLFANVAANGSISANISYKGGTIELLRDKNFFSVYAVEMKSDFVNRLANKEFFKDGVFSATISGDSENEFSGIITIRDTKLKDFAVLNNVIAFINTIPALATLSDPRYSSSGFPVKSGLIEFSRMGDFIYIPNLFLEGYSSDIGGVGYISLDSDEIYLDLKISTIKALSGIIDMIPLVNFIVLGEDGNIEITVSVRGTVSEPKVETNIIGDTLMSPINVIKRVFQLPFWLFR
ncbi:MAG: AsmA-like C-terminal domain-containing protein [Campylobacteraceae bacterium]|nr:AsmA-like C-terminal domain-containing protein [Campylobacteraceae bacterium]